MLKVIIQKSDSIQEQMGNVSKAMDSEKESKGNSRNQKH